MSSVTGGVFKRNPNKPPLQRLDPVKLTAINSILRHYMKSKGECEVAIDFESQSVSRYLASKIADLRRLPRQRKNEQPILENDNSSNYDEDDHQYDNLNIENIDNVEESYDDLEKYDGMECHDNIEENEDYMEEVQEEETVDGGEEERQDEELQEKKEIDEDVEEDYDAIEDL